ncbi:MAG: hypothetical protein UZ18_ATM001001186 [Armatimonadetes bacterium OLB18]|nr:MAG: hypothetical protein UZ18_ATM001001186 [Armatimonadetes bacterium OLB18]
MAQSDVTLRARLAAAGALILAAAAGAQISGDRQFPQTRSLSLLPGGGVPVSSEGVPGWEGALTLSTPIAYSLRAKEGVYVMGNTNYARWPKLFDARKGEGDSNGSLGLQFGSRMFRGNATFSWMFVDSRLKNVYHIHYSPDLKGRWRLGAGLQDVFWRQQHADSPRPNEFGVRLRRGDLRIRRRRICERRIRRPAVLWVLRERERPHCRRMEGVCRVRHVWDQLGCRGPSQRAGRRRTSGGRDVRLPEKPMGHLDDRRAFLKRTAG